MVTSSIGSQRRPARILVRATNWVGDAVMSLPALQAIRNRFPDAHVAVLARPWVADIYARESFADQVIRYTAPSGWRGVGAKIRTAIELRKLRFDVAILLQNAFEAAAIAWAAGIPERIGYDRDGRGLLLTQAVQVPRESDLLSHQRFYYLELLRRSGLIESLPPCPEIRLGGRQAAAEAGRRRFSEAGWGQVTGLSPGAAFGSAKRWLPDRFAEAALELGCPVAIFGSPGERELCEQVAGAIRSGGLPAHNYAGETTLNEYIELAAACTVYLTNDSGGMHIASALGIPTVAIFGSTDHTATGPTGSTAAVVREPVECSPCLKRECPIDHRCMTRVSAARVVSEARLLLSMSQSK